MDEFHYNYILTKYETDDIYEDFYENKHLLDFSDYPEDSQFFVPVNNKIIGKMKDKVKEK